MANESGNAMRLMIAAALTACCWGAWAGEIPKDISEITTLTAEQAKALSQHEGALWLTGLTSLDAKTAEVLAASKAGWLCLSGLPTLDAATARALAKFKGDTLCLTGVEKLDPDTAGALADFGGSHLLLDGLTTLDAETARSLVNAKAWTGRLPRVTTLDTDTARVLVGFKGRLPHLNDGSKLLDADAAKANAQFKYVLWLDGLTSLAHEAAAVLRSNPQIKLPEQFQRFSKVRSIGKSQSCVTEGTGGWHANEAGLEIGRAHV